MGAKREGSHKGRAKLIKGKENPGAKRESSRKGVAKIVRGKEKVVARGLPSSLEKKAILRKEKTKAVTRGLPSLSGERRQHQGRAKLARERKTRGRSLAIRKNLLEADLW